MADHPVLERFSPAVREWFATSFPEPTPPRSRAGRPSPRASTRSSARRPVAARRSPPSSASIDRLVTTPPPEGRAHRTRVLYISPLRALAFDVEKNLRAPLAGIGLAAERLGVPFVAPDGRRCAPATPAAKDRQALIRRPPDLLITTPESLYLMLTSSARETLRRRRDGHHRRDPRDGAHQARRPPDAPLERLEEITRAAAAAHRAVGHAAPAGGGRPLPRRVRGARREPRPVTIVDAGIRKPLEVEVVVPVEDMGDLGPGDGRARAAARPARRWHRARSSIWPSIYPRILELVLAHRSTIIFCNARRLAERLAASSTSWPTTRASTAGGGRRARQGPPRLAGPRAARRHRGPAEAGRAAGDRRHLAASSSASTWARSTS